MKIHQWLFLWLCLASLPVHSALVENLYSVELAVPDQTTAVRLDAFRQAFRDVIVKVSGSDDALQHAGMARALKSSARYVREFRYILRQPPKPAVSGVSPNTAEGDENGDQLFLRVTFNRDAVENLLRSNNISIWGQQRPGTLLLVSIDIDGNSRLVSGDSTPELIDELSVQAEKRGLPILFPLMDLEDRQQFDVQDVLQMNQQNLTVAAARYAPDALLVGQISTQTGADWRARWQAQFSGKMFNWTFSSPERSQMVSQAMQQLARLLASEYALQANMSVQDVLFTVDDIPDLQAHLRVLSYLQSLDAVVSARLVLIDQGTVIYRLELRNSSEDLSRLITLGSTLEQLELPQIDASSEDQTIRMHYRLLR